MKANAAIRPEDPAEDYHSDDAVNRNQRIQEVGEVKHVCSLSVDKYPSPITMRSVISITLKYLQSVGLDHGTTAGSPGQSEVR